jgi:N-acetylmuramoyl-L-alanine amidase
MSIELSELMQGMGIERVAQTIADPIERLRYLRMAPGTAAAPLRWTRRQLVGVGAAAGLALAIRSNASHKSAGSVRVTAAQPVTRQPADTVQNVWPVEQNTQYDLYSNGLRIENGLAVANEARSYRLLFRETLEPGPRRSQPAGIVFHTTESGQPAFESGQKPALKRIGREVLLYVRNRRAYHFVIDRFGRVHRIVAETDTANHAGHSIWADDRWVYVDLNESFLGVAFEASMRGEEPLTQAQITAARALTEVLRSSYRIAAGDCVTHAQVSVNPANMLIGWHTDWGSRFPFREIGLPDNYQIPNPSLYAFGFEYDPVYLNSSGGEVWKSLQAAEQRVRQAAAEHGMSVTQYRGRLRQNYARARAGVYRQGKAEEIDNEQN